MKNIYLIVGLLFISTMGKAQLQNMDFEQWHLPVQDTGFIMSNRPLEWDWTSGVNTWEDTHFYNPPVTEAQNNQYALQLSVWYNHTKDAAIQTATIDYRPARLTGFYKYTDNIVYGQMEEANINDTAMVAVYLTTVQPWPLVIDTVGMGWVHLSHAEGYTAFEVDITYTSDVEPHFITVLLDPSLVNRHDGRYYSAQPGPTASFFTIDNLMLEGEAVLSTDDINSNSISLYPNPAVDIITITLKEKSDIYIYNLTGGLVESFNAQATHNLDVTNYAKGIYIIKSNDETLRFVKE